MKGSIMRTYSDKIAGIRAFLKAASAIHVNSIEARCPVGQTLETWSIKGREIILKISVDGSWQAFVQATGGEPSELKIQSVEKHFRESRPDLDSLDSLEYLVRVLLNKIGELPGCSDPGCSQTICRSNRSLKEELEKFIGLKPVTKDEA